MKKVFYVSGICLGVILLSGFALWQFVNSSWLGNFMAEKAFRLTGARLEFRENPKITLFPASLRIRDVAWQSPDTNPQLTFSARELRVSFDLLSIFQEQMRIREIFLNEPWLTIKEDAQKSENSSAKGSHAKSKGHVSEKFSVQLDRLMLMQGGLLYKSPDHALWLNQLNLSAENIGPRLETDLKCDFQCGYGEKPVEEASSYLAGNMAVRTKVRYYAPSLTFRQTALTFTATRNDVAIDLSPVWLDGEGAYNFEDHSLRLTSSLLKTRIFQFMLKGEYISREKGFSGHASLDFPQTPPETDTSPDIKQKIYNIILASPVSYDGKVVSFPDIAISSGDSKGSGKLAIELPRKNAKMKISGTLAFGNLELLQGRERAKKVQKAPGTQNTDKGEEKFSWPDMDLSMSAKTLKYARLAAENISVQLLGDAGVYDLKNLKFAWANGTAEGSGKLHVADRLVRLKTSGKKINIGQALWETGLAGFSGGVADYEADLASSGFTLQSIRQSLTGNFNFKSRNVKIALLEEMAKFVSRFSSETALIPKGIDNFSVQATADMGKISLESINLSSEKLKAKAKGQIDLWNDSVSAELDLDIFGMQLPVDIDGTLSGLSWRIEPAWLKRFWQEL